MVAVTVPSRGSLLPRGLAALRGAVVRIARPARPVLANLASVPLHVAGLACLDVAAFTGNTIAGWAITGLSLIWLEHVIADEQ